MDFTAEIAQSAKTFHLDVQTLTAQIRVESQGNPWAYNPEPVYHYLWNVHTKSPFRTMSAAEISSDVPPKDFPTLIGDPDQEFWAQRASFGLLQIMGAVAREQGFVGPYLTELCDPVLNLSLGCAKLADLLLWANGNLTQALCAYNGGKGGNSVAPFRNQAYADRVFATRSRG